MNRLEAADQRRENISYLQGALGLLREGDTERRLVLQEEIRSEKLAKAALQGGQILIRV